MFRCDQHCFCRTCGKEISARSLRCSSCASFAPALLIHLLSALLFMVACLAWTVFAWKLLPALAANLAHEGRRLLLFTRVSIAICNHMGHWSVLWLPLIGSLYIYLSFFFKPAKNIGAALVLSAVLVFLLSTVAVYLLCLFQWATIVH